MSDAHRINKWSSEDWDFCEALKSSNPEEGIFFNEELENADMYDLDSDDSLDLSDL